MNDILKTINTSKPNLMQTSVIYNNKIMTGE